MTELNAGEVWNRRVERHAALPGRHDRALRSYHNMLDTIMRTDESYDILFIVDDLLQDYYELDDATAAISLRDAAVDLLPTDDMFNSSETHRQAKELLMLFPLRYMDHDVSQYYTLNQAESWYFHVGSAIIDRTSKLHTEECGNHPSIKGCVHSVQCPRRILTETLTASVSHPDFDELAYGLQPEVEVSLARMKMNVAIDLHLTTQSKGSGQIRFYDHLVATKHLLDS